MSLYGDGLVIRLLVVINFEMHRNIELLCCTSGTNSIVGQLYFRNKFTEKEISNLWLQEARNGEV